MTRSSFDDTVEKGCGRDTCLNFECFPQYGVAPHECYWRKEGGFAKNPLGTSTIIDVEKWPNNFLAEIDPDQPISSQIRWGLCGVHYCPDCKEGMRETSTLWGPEKIIAVLKVEAANV